MADHKPAGDRVSVDLVVLEFIITETVCDNSCIEIEVSLGVH